MITDNFISYPYIFTQILRIAAIVILSYLALKVVERFIPKLLGEGFKLVKKTGLTSEEQRSKKRMLTIVSVFRGLLKTIIYLVAGMMVLSEFGVNITPIIASAGIIGLAVGFGAQTLVKDFINGIFILFEDQFGEGDFIQIDAYKGKVERMNLRSTTLRDFNGVMHIIPNSRITIVSNLSRDFAKVNLDIQFPKEIKIDDAFKILKTISEDLISTKKMENIVIKNPEVLGIEDIDMGKYVIKVVVKTEALKQYDVARKYRYLFKKEMEKYEEKKS
ncbi:hypothetical protein A2X44_05390 [candidate division CPR3 bacterium GWF2_35_18]|uniref:MscS Mechanosensitive ion channel n=1 Tax=candidate division CPR3 bacterium GW2011_GWF2_35_18 TaxID=1618350 RepID=A0A0G0EP98_UNCC3|nr:MAG: MscS Mechanosensitive ion channel [candidate division CPR3 bacterium GW2011_GWF2_35_18]KKP87196.1 MAG: MscS Mechanosensitive ion channel [candidate division CPR3 bacterium GW2011_GWE2_35_7]OGB63833.1 MAG: hypothetical protein A2X44_05390 [candidate division CPR3 bacterium GWF2_35_18]OGB65220.1 MAG: hypothetical protein A2250_03140 [candidate division CPR3 bacterium RIFOXYA2_FULL_35_13]OGB78885.1 MAG: hypothetical protein A2296_04120 [candidate division CPR3 bacterium RIFOXYB2_FULL_35_8]